MPKGSNAGGERELPRRQKALPPQLMGKDYLVTGAGSVKGVDLSAYDGVLSDAQKLAAVLLARGKRKCEVAREIGVNENTIYNWSVANKDFRRLINECISQLIMEPISAMSPLVPLALGVYEDALKQRDDLRTAVTVAENVIDRVHGKPIVRTMSQSVASVTLNIISDPSADASRYVEADIADEEEGEEQEG